MWGHSPGDYLIPPHNDGWVCIACKRDSEVTTGKGSGKEGKGRQESPTISARGKCLVRGTKPGDVPGVELAVATVSIRVDLMQPASIISDIHLADFASTI